jgi:hypothetical protein
MTASDIAQAQRAQIRARALAYAEKAVASPFVAYTLIIALQLRVLWNVWKYADLTTGDTSFYFVDAASWAHGLHENLVYYPLYDAFWGTILALVHNIYGATIIHRVAIIFAATLLVLVLMRALLGPALGLLIAAWWTVVPADNNPVYEVHLFGALPVLLAVLVVAIAPRRTGLGIAVAILLTSAVLVRTELIAAAALLGAATLTYELRELRKGRGAPKITYLRAYALPLALACILIGGAYERSYIQGATAWQQLEAKEKSNFCESYAFSFQQRHPSRFTGNPFSECSPLMRQTFGMPMPSLLQGISANPRAVAAFGSWNAHLLPSGLQVSLFGATALETDPGFKPVTEHSTYALILSVLLLIIVIGGLGVVTRSGGLSPRRMSARKRWLLVTLACIVATDLLVVLTVRPWADYIYGLAICALILVGVCILALMRRIGGIRILAPIALVTVLVLIAMTSSVYSAGPRPIYEGVKHLQVVEKQLQRPGSVLVAGENYNVLCNYLAYSYQRMCSALYWPAVRSRVTSRISAGQVLDQLHATALYVEAGMLGDPIIAGLIAAPGAQGWQQVARGSGAGGPWRVLIPLSQTAS